MALYVEKNPDIPRIMKIIITPTGRTHLRSPMSNESIFPAKLSVSIFIKNANDLEKIVKEALRSNQKTILLAIYNNQNQRRYIGVKLN